MIYLTIKGLEPNTHIPFPEVIIDGRLYIYDASQMCDNPDNPVLVSGYTDCNGCIIIPLKLVSNENEQ